MAVSIDDLANPANLLVFIDATSSMTGTSVNMVREVMAKVLESQLRRRSDDMQEVAQLGRILQAVRVESDSARRVSEASR